MGNSMKLSKEITEYRYFLQEYLLPLLSISWKNTNIPSNKPISEDKKSKYIYQTDDLLICFTNKKYILFELQHDKKLSEDSLRIANNIVACYTDVSKYNLISGKKKIDYYSDVQQNANYKMAIQKGICDWIIGHENEKVEKLFEILENWSVKTYEGKKVTFGFIINPNATSTFDTSYGDWCDFLEDDFSAVLTDCVNSVIELDKNCDFCRYLSITEGNTVAEYQLTPYLPFRFSNVIETYVKGECVGIFLLNNGDIILSKKGRVLFVKRNLKWLNLGYDAFEKAFGGYLHTHTLREGLLQEVFASMLDVSFSHTGGIIAVVNDCSLLSSSTSKEEEPTVSESDDLSNKFSLSEITNHLSESNRFSKTEIRKRILKRNIILSLLGEKNFTELDRKLRCELISLDGACIIGNDGKICSFGAIIKNDSGSSGGGRGAAAKKLSRSGFAIKISTDGYIELYINGEQAYAIK